MYRTDAHLGFCRVLRHLEDEPKRDNTSASHPTRPRTAKHAIDASEPAKTRSASTRPDAKQTTLHAGVAVLASADDDSKSDDGATIREV